MVLPARLADLHERLPVKPPRDTSRQVISPMPGLVVSVAVAAGEAVQEGQAICVVEAMKMQNILRAERAGVVARLNVKPGDSVAADEVIAEFG